MRYLSLNLFLRLVVLWVASITTIQAESMSSLGQEKVIPLLKESISTYPGHNITFIEVNYLPGQSTPPHKHPGPIVAYVLEGTMISQLEGQKPVTYHKGEYWYEPPYTGHVLAKNASNTQSAKLLVWILLDDKDPVKLPNK